MSFGLAVSWDGYVFGLEVRVQVSLKIKWDCYANTEKYMLPKKNYYKIEQI